MLVDPFLQVQERACAEFMQDHPEIDVRQEYVVGLAGHYHLKLSQQILSGTLPDVALIQLGPFHEMAEHFADLSDLLRPPREGEPPAEPPLSTALDPVGMEAFRVSGRQLGLPLCGGNLLIYGNETCFDRASRFRGTPIARPTADWTIEDFHRTAKLLTCDFDDDGTIDQFGFWHPRWIYYLPMLWSFGAELTDESMTRWTLLGPKAEEALTFYRDLLIHDRVCPRDEEVPQLFQDVGFLTSKVAMCVNGPWFQPFLDRTRLADSYFVAHIPMGSTGRVTRVTWDGIVAASNLPDARRAAAHQFIRYVLSKPVQDRIARVGRALPARIEATQNFVGSPPDPRRQVFVDALAYSRLQPLLPRFSQIDRVINKHLNAFVQPGSELTAATMLERLAREPVIISTFSTPELDSP